MNQLPATVIRVTDALHALGHPHEPVMFDTQARTSQEAADALETLLGHPLALGQIIKSIVFRRAADDVPVLVETSGDHRVDEAKVAAIVGELARADAAYIKKTTGFSIGGVSPIGLLCEPVTLIDRTIFRFDEIWAAAGHPRAVFPLTPDELVRYTGAPVEDVTEDAS